MEMNGEMMNLCKVWLTIFASLTYCYYIPRNITTSIKNIKITIRLLSLLPIITLFTLLPLNLSSPHLCFFTALFVTWLANFKLLLLAFHRGPLLASSDLSLLRFISVASLPIKITHHHHQNAPNSLLHYSLKFLLLALVLRLYDYHTHLHPYLIFAIHGIYVYLSLEIIFAVVVAPARTVLRLEIEPQFDEPYLSTSLQNFWGRRWNLMVSSILRHTVYQPMRSVAEPLLGRTWALATAIFVTFVVSGIMHELLYYYLTLAEPTWEVTWFFVLHGVCTAAEVLVKKAVVGWRWRLNQVVSGVLTIGFMVVSSFWLFFPQIVRNGVDMRMMDEYGIVFQFLKDQLLVVQRLVYGRDSQ